MHFFEYGGGNALGRVVYGVVGAVSLYCGYKYIGGKLVDLFTGVNLDKLSSPMLAKEMAAIAFSLFIGYQFTIIFFRIFIYGVLGLPTAIKVFY